MPHDHSHDHGHDHSHDHPHTHEHSHDHGHGGTVESADGVVVPQGEPIAPTRILEGPERADRHLWIDASQGAAGDMLLGALLDAGADAGSVAAVLDTIAPGKLHLQTRTVIRGPFRAAKIDVIADEPNPPARHLADIERMLDHPDVPGATRTLALTAFRRLAEAEAHVHGATVDSIHFHEVGALDSIGDIIGVCEAVRTLGISRATSSVVALGAGTVSTQHGLLTVPPPAVLELAVGWPVEAGGPEGVGELCTPTGMALIRALCEEAGPMPQLSPEAVGIGAGTRVREDRAGVVRAVIGTPSDTGGAVFRGDDEVQVVEANVDDLDPRLWPGVLEALLEAGAADAWLTPILMKKGRPAYIVSAITHADRLDAVTDVLVSHTSTIGVRVSAPAHRRVLDRTQVSLDVDGTPVRIKVSGTRGTTVSQATPEFVDVADLAVRLGIPQAEALARCRAAAWEADLRAGSDWPAS